MDVDAHLWLQHVESPAEVSRILLHLPESDEAESVIQVAVALAKATRAKVRGLTVVDTKALRELVTCEAAGHAVSELQRLQIGSLRRNEVRAVFSRLCLEGGLDFDLCRKQGDVRELLGSEAQAHDLSIALVSSGRNSGPPGLGLPDVMSLLQCASGPWLLVRERTVGQRVLFAHDGTPQSLRAIRSFVRRRLFPGATARMLGIGPTAREAQTQLHEGLDLIRQHFPNCEAGFLTGRPAQVTPAYARQWDADLVVVGAQRSSALARYLYGEQAAMVLDRTNCAVYATS